MGEEKAYIVRAMKAKCDCGTMENYLNVVNGHGVYYKGEPLLNANDHYKDENLSHFGDCNSKKVYEDAKKQADEKYKAEEGDGFFESVGKGIGKFFTKAAITAKSLMFNKCDLQTPTPWIFTNEEHVIDGAPALTIESKCACLYGGVITIVMEVEEAPAEERKEGEEEEIETGGLAVGALAAALQEGMDAILKGRELQVASVSTNSVPMVGTSGMNAESLMKVSNSEESDTVIGTNYGEKASQAGIKIAEQSKTAEESMITNLSNKESEKLILPPPVTKQLLEYMGILKQTEEDIEYLNKLLKQEQIQSPGSILFFLATVAVEANVTWGKAPIEIWTESYAKSVSYTYEKRGAGYIQLTGEENHFEFLQKKYNEIINSTELSKEEKEKELKKMSEVLNEKGELKSKEAIKKVNTAKIIAENYPWDASVFFWEDRKHIEQYLLDNGVKIQTYLVIQYWVNFWRDGDILEDGQKLTFSSPEEREKKINEIEEKEKEEEKERQKKEEQDMKENEEDTKENEDKKKEQDIEISLQDTLKSFKAETEQEKLFKYFGKYEFLDGSEEIYFINPNKIYNIFPLPSAWDKRVEKYNLIMSAYPELGKTWDLTKKQINDIDDRGKAITESNK